MVAWTTNRSTNNALRVSWDANVRSPLVITAIANQYGVASVHATLKCWYRETA